MGICNVTGVESGELFDYYINGDFGYNANYLNDKEFSFTMSLEEHEKLIRKGRDKLAVDMSREDFTNQYGRWFTSEQVYDLISTFQKPPKGFFSQGWLQFTEEEEQVLWDHMGNDIEDCYDMFGHERAEELRTIQRGY